MTEQHEFDFFISYTKSDEGWAEWIAWQLEAVKPPYSTFLQAWDFHAGDDWVRLMQRGTTKARRTIAVLSPELFKAKYTQAEWDRAARGLEGRKFPWGSNPIEQCQVNNENAGVGHPTPVGIFSRDVTPEGILDLGGNVLEWCADWYTEYSVGKALNPRGPFDCSRRLYRGGSWYFSAGVARSAFRLRGLPSLRLSFLGFRLALSPLGPARGASGEVGGRASGGSKGSRGAGDPA